MTKPPYRVFFSPAECWEGCDIPQCPYTHMSVWCVTGLHSPFETERDAQKAADAMNAGHRALKRIVQP